MVGNVFDIETVAQHPPIDRQFSITKDRIPCETDRRVYSLTATILVMLSSMSRCVEVTWKKDARAEKEHRLWRSWKRSTVDKAKEEQTNTKHHTHTHTSAEKGAIEVEVAARSQPGFLSTPSRKASNRRRCLWPYSNREGCGMQRSKGRKQNPNFFVILETNPKSIFANPSKCPICGIRLFCTKRKGRAGLTGDPRVSWAWVLNGKNMWQQFRKIRCS